MHLKRTPILLAEGLLVLATLTLFHSVARAGCDGCPTRASLLPSICGKGCHYRPGNCPTLCSPETYGYYPTVWTIWPGPLDRDTSYPGVKAAVPAPAEKPAETKPEEKPK